MAKEKKSKNASLPQKNVHLRLAFLHQAASHLVDRMQNDRHQIPRTEDNDAPVSKTLLGVSVTQPRYLVNQMKGVGRKSVIRLHKHTKRSVCKRCDELLVDGKNAVREVENKSRNQSKPWADVHVVKCLTCGTSKRFPIGADCLNQKPKRGSEPGQHVHSIVE